MPMEMVSCGNCKRCLIGVKAHGPYLYVYVTKGGSKHHLYGKKVKSPELPDATVSAEEVKRMRRELEVKMRREADREYEKRKKLLTPEHRKKIDEQMETQNRLQQKRREKSRTLKKRTHDGMTASVIRAIKEEVEAQFSHEIAELKKQLKEGRAELRQMLKEEE